MERVHWNEYHRAWSAVTSPLRPNPEVVAIMDRLIRKETGRVLLLGSTPEFANLAGEIVAMDRNFPFLSAIWPGNSANRWAVAGDWLRTSFAAESFNICIGDGSFTPMNFPDDNARLRDELARILQPGGRVVCRLYASPETAEPIEEIRAATVAGTVKNFHAFKWRLAMSLAARESTPNVQLQSIFDVFTEIFPDRKALATITGWPQKQIDTIDHYNNKTNTFSFPTVDQLVSIMSGRFSNIELVLSGNYELAERCPILVMQKS